METADGPMRGGYSPFRTGASAFSLSSLATLLKEKRGFFYQRESSNIYLDAPWRNEQRFLRNDNIEHLSSNFPSNRISINRNFYKS